MINDNKKELDAKMQQIIKMDYSQYFEFFNSTNINEKEQIKLYLQEIIKNPKEVGNNESKVIAEITEIALKMLQNPNRIKDKVLVNNLQILINDINKSYLQEAQTNKGFIKKLFTPKIKEVKNYELEKYGETSGKNIENFYIEIKRFQHMIEKDIELVFQLQNNLQKAYEKISVQIKSYILYKEQLKTDINTEENNFVQGNNNYITVIAIENKIASLNLSLANAKTILPQIFEMQKTNCNLFYQIKESFIVTLPILRNLIVEETQKIKSNNALQSHLVLAKADKKSINENKKSIASNQNVNENLNKMRQCLFDMEKGLNVFDTLN